MKKKFVSLLLVASFMLSMMPVYAVDLSSTKLTEVSAEYGLTAEDNMHFFKKGDWMLSVAYENGSTIYVAANKDGTVYQKVVEGLPVGKIEISNVLNIFETEFSNPDTFEMIVPDNDFDVQSETRYDYIGRMNTLLRNREGTGYSNAVLVSKTYQGKSFTVKESKDVLQTMENTDVPLDFEQGLSLLAVLTLFALNVPPVVYDETKDVLEDLMELGSTLAELPRDERVHTCYGSAVYIRATYTSGVSYLINSTSKSNEYTFLYRENYSASSTNPSMTLTHTVYQHGEGYFNNTDS